MMEYDDQVKARGYYRVADDSEAWRGTRQEPLEEVPGVGVRGRENSGKFPGPYDRTDSGGPMQTPNVTLDLVVRQCNSGACPTVYRTNRGTLVVQGNKLGPAEAGVTVPDGEGMVEIPAELLIEFARKVE